MVTLLRHEGLKKCGVVWCKILLLDGVFQTQQLTWNQGNLGGLLLSLKRDKMIYHHHRVSVEGNTTKKKNLYCSGKYKSAVILKTCISLLRGSKLPLFLFKYVLYNEVYDLFSGTNFNCLLVAFALK